MQRPTFHLVICFVTVLIATLVLPQRLFPEASQSSGGPDVLSWDITSSTSIVYPVESPPRDLLGLGWKSDISFGVYPWETPISLGTSVEYIVVGVNADTSLSVVQSTADIGMSVKLAPGGTLRISGGIGGYYALFNDTVRDTTGEKYPIQTGGAGLLSTTISLMAPAAERVNVGFHAGYNAHLGLFHGFSLGISVAYQKKTQIGRAHV